MPPHPTTLLLALLFAALTATASTHRTLNLLRGSEITIGAELEISDPWYGYSDPKLSFQESIIRVGLKNEHTDLTYYSSSQSWQVEYTIALVPVAGTGNTIFTSQTLEITYDPAGNTYYSEAVLDYTGYRAASIELTSISGGPMPTGMVFTVELIQQMRYDLNPSVAPTLQLLKTSSLIEDKNVLPVCWQYRYGDDSYDLEWLFVDVPTDDIGNVDLSTITYDFRNATRINLQANHYDIPLAYPTGVLLVRVRATGWRGAGSNAYYCEGPWSTPGTIGTANSIPTAAIFLYQGLEQDENWQYMATFAENGKRKEVITFFDGSLRSRQQVTVLNSNDISVVGETMYDYMGRGSLQVLPTPVPSEGIRYYANNTGKVFNEGYNRDDFDTDGKIHAPDEFPAGIGPSLYYSAQNPFLATQYPAAIASIPTVCGPLAGGYPYTRTRYLNDGSGRIHSQSGVGGAHKLGSNHETKYYYGRPTGQRELDTLFGNEIGEVAFYRKDMVMDPNGLVSVSLLDPQGRVRATAISKNTESNMEDVDYAKDTVHTSTEQLLSNQLPNPNGEIVSTTVLSVSSPGEYDFSYQLDPLYYTDACMGTNTVQQCVYDLSITVYDNQEDDYIFDTLFTHIGSTTLIPIEFPLNLQVGNYIVTKVLTPNRDSLEAYMELYRTTQNCLPLADIPWDSCDFSCGAHCKGLIVDSVWINDTLYFMNIEGDTLTSAEADTLIAICRRADCATADSTEYDECAIKKRLMCRDLSPDGQYFDNLPMKFDTNLKPLTNYDINGWLKSHVSSSYSAIDGLFDDLTLPAAITTADAAWDYVRANWDESFNELLFTYHPEYCTWFFYCENTVTNGECSPNPYPIMELSNQFDADFQACSYIDFTSNYYNPMGIQASGYPNDPLYHSGTTTGYIGNTPYGGKTDPFFNGCTYDLLDNFGASVTISPFAARMRDSLLQFLPLKDNQGQFGSLYLNIWYVLDDPHNVAIDNTLANVPTTLRSYLTNGYNQDALDIFNELHNRIMNPDSLNLNKYDLFRSVYLLYKRQILQEIFESKPSGGQYYYSYSSTNCPCSANPKNYYIAEMGPSLPYGALKSTAGFYAHYYHDPALANDSWENITSIVSEMTCRSQCEGFADDWMESLYGHINPTDAAAIRGYLVDICARSCTNQYPYGQKEIVLGAPPVNNWENFEDVLESYYSGQGSALDALITHPPVVTTPAECSCTRLTELLDDLGLSWNDGSTAIANALEAIWDTLYSDIAIQAWANDCNPSNLPGMTLEDLQDDDFPDKLLCQGLPQTSPDYITDPMVAYTDSCNNRAKAQAALASLMINDRLLSSATKLYGASYLKHCLDSAAESFTCAYTRKEYHYTLYYYDQAGNLIKTVPPAGVNRLDQTDLNSSMAHRADTSLPFMNAAHGLVTNYKYNSLNQVREQSTPDGGVTRFWYDALGRLIVSQNAKQAEQTPIPAYSYTLYDPLGRIIEVGQLEATEDPGEFLGFEEFKTWLSGAANHSQITHTVYDVAINGTLIQSQLVLQENLRNRISCVLYQPTRVQTTSFFLPDLSEYDYASYYSYDAHGNVKTVVHHDQYFENIFTSVELTKKIDYLYDLVSGSVKEVIYQQTKADEFRHRYHYDADNRITRVYTSRNGMIWQLDAKYFYYPHGPLARVEVGQEQVQAFDYAYTLHGWLKGVNTNTLVANTDIGKDGEGTTDNANRWFGRDAAGFSLGYYSGDYQAIGSGGGDFLNANLQNVYSSGSDLFNGNISHMVTAIYEVDNPPAFTPVPQATTYRYDRLNRIKEMKAYQGTVIDGAWTAQNTQTFASAYQYDFNGNITELERYAGGTQIDDLEYFYNHDNHIAKTGLASNRLYLVNEDAAATSGDDLQPFNYGKSFDKNDPSSWNYNYDRIGNLVKDTSEGISLIHWTVTGKVSDVIFKVDLPNNSYNLAFRYDPMGNRIAKIKKPHATLANCTTWTVTWYSRDAQGNVLAVYTKPENSTAFSATEFNIYGSSRIGMVTSPEQLNEILTVPVAHSQILGNKVYELSNHLGNVLTTFSDRKIAIESISDLGYVGYYTAEILSSTDYYPFGFQMPGRVYEADGYRYGFNSMEKDDELKGSGNSYDFGARIYDPRVGRWLAVDPLAGSFPGISSYNYCYNNPVIFTDPNGKAGIVTINKNPNGGGTITIESIIFVYGEDAKETARKANDYFSTNFVANGGNSYTYYDEYNQPWVITVNAVYVYTKDLDVQNTVNGNLRSISQGNVKVTGTNPTDGKQYEFQEPELGGSMIAHSVGNSSELARVAEDTRPALGFGSPSGGLAAIGFNNFIHEMFHGFGLMVDRDNLEFKNDVLWYFGGGGKEIKPIHFLDFAENLLNLFNSSLSYKNGEPFACNMTYQETEDSESKLKQQEDRKNKYNSAKTDNSQKKTEPSQPKPVGDSTNNKKKQ